MPAHRIPVQADAAQGVGGGVHRHLQAPGVIARRVEGAGIKAGGQLPRGFDVELPVGGQEEILVTDDVHMDMGHGGGRHHPVLGNHLGQVFAGDIETDRLAIALGGETLVPAHRIHIKMVQLDPPDQGMVEDVLLPGLAVRQGIGPHQRRKAARVRWRCCSVQARVDHPVVGVVPGAAPRAADTAKTHYDR